MRAPAGRVQPRQHASGHRQAALMRQPTCRVERFIFMAEILPEFERLAKVRARAPRVCRHKICRRIARAGRVRQGAGRRAWLATVKACNAAWRVRRGQPGGPTCLMTTRPSDGYESSAACPSGRRLRQARPGHGPDRSDPRPRTRLLRRVPWLSVPGTHQAHQRVQRYRP